MSFTASIDEIVAANHNGLLSRHPSWARVRLGDVCAILNGYPFPSAQFTRDDGFPLLRIRDVGSFSTEARFKGDFDAMYVVRRGELVVGMDGDFNCAAWAGPQALLNQRTCKVTPNPNYLGPGYLSYLLPGYLSAINANTPSMTVKHLSSLTVADLPVALPPRGEQDRLTAVLDAYFTRLNDAVATLERVQRNLKRYRASVLKAAVEGRLVPIEAELARAEGRDYEPASVLLKRTIADRRRRWQEAGGRGKYQEPAAPRASELPELPEGWCYASLPQLGELNRGRSKHRPRNDPRLLGGPYPFIQTGDVRNADGAITSHETTYSEFGLAQSRLWPMGTLCITIAANIAETGILRFDACFPDSVVGFLPDDLLTTRYVEFFIRTARERLAQYAPATAQKNINLQTLSEIAIPLPPAAEQARIVAEIDRQFSVARHCQEVAFRGDARCSRLRQSILKWAFEGKLADQDPSDEPASVLLERIRTETGARMASATSGATQRHRGQRGTMTGTKHKK